MKTLKFYDVKAKKKFNSTKYTFKAKRTRAGMRYFAISKAPSKIMAWRIVSKDFYMANKGGKK